MLGRAPVGILRGLRAVQGVVVASRCCTFARVVESAAEDMRFKTIEHRGAPTRWTQEPSAPSSLTTSTDDRDASTEYELHEIKEPALSMLWRDTLLAVDRDLSPAHRAKLVDRLKRNIALGKASPAADLFEKLTFPSPELLARLSPDEFAGLLELVAHGVDHAGNLTRKRRLEVARRIVAVAGEVGAPLGKHAVRPLLDLHAAVGDTAGVDRLLDEMRASGTDTSTPELLALQSRAHLLAGESHAAKKIWDDVVAVDPPASLSEHIFATAVLKRDISDAMRTLDTCIQQSNGALPPQRFLVDLCHVMLARRRHDGLERLFKLAAHTDALHAHPVCVRAATHLALAGRFEPVLDMLASRRAKTQSALPVSLRYAEIVARDGLGQAAKLPDLLAAIPRARSDSRIAAEAAVALTHHVGALGHPSHLHVRLATHPMLVRANQAAALQMLLRGYTETSDLVSARCVLDRMLRHRVDLPARTTVRLLELFVNKRMPDEALEILEALCATTPMSAEMRRFAQKWANNAAVLEQFPWLELRLRKLRLALEESA
ncbi:hypothetical protein HK105_207830 [Polyrhizophydium stewartii]|uniref:Uncharacterized protein n=1 Tax=Polyrhizophydium stewartii TaxID=2732419 RepID=A0ABR4MZM5_9FUNG|nr:hypothetical protein HK105_000682 [Polyrhizophydium stewartii]